MAMLDMRPETMQPALAIEDVELAGSLSGYASVFGLSDLRNDVVERGRSPARPPRPRVGRRQSARMRAAFMSRAGWRGCAMRWN